MQVLGTATRQLACGHHCGQAQPAAARLARGRSAFLRGSGAVAAVQRRQQRGATCRRSSQIVRADVNWGQFEEEEIDSYYPEWPNAEYIQEVKQMEEAGELDVVSVEQARVLAEELGYTYLDVRPALELDVNGKIKGTRFAGINVPIMNAERKYSSEEKKKVVKKEPNDQFLAQVEKKFPDKENTKIIIGCSDGKQYSMDALVQLDEAGYSQLCGLRGGYAAWYRVFDNKGGRRRTGEYAENYSHDGDSTGIHGSGAGFERVDAIEQWSPQGL